jgi:hypothetical protein
VGTRVLPLQACRSKKTWRLGFDVWIDLVRTLCVSARGGAFALGSFQLFLGRALSLHRSLLQGASFLSSLDCLRSLPVGTPLRRASGETTATTSKTSTPAMINTMTHVSMLFLPRSSPPPFCPSLPREKRSGEKHAA